MGGKMVRVTWMKTSSKVMAQVVIENGRNSRFRSAIHLLIPKESTECKQIYSIFLNCLMSLLWVSVICLTFCLTYRHAQITNYWGFFCPVY